MCVILSPLSCHSMKATNRFLTERTTDNSFSSRFFALIMSETREGRARELKQKFMFSCVGGLKTYIKFDYHMADGTFFTPIRNLSLMFFMLRSKQ